MSLEENFIYQKDYCKPEFVIKSCELDFFICDDYVDVTNNMEILRSEDHNKNLVLDGIDINLISVFLDGSLLSSSDYICHKESLELKKSSSNFSLSIKSRLYPDKNTALEGLYQSKGIICTQCEPGGFRRITYFLDRPDVLSTYKVRIEALKERYPVLLSNGNLVAKGECENSRHWVCYEDPFPKPSYLFALVAGNLSCLKSSYKSSSGRDISLEIYASDSQIDQCDFAMVSLKKSLAWDEDTYALECDLDVYKIVAISDFNMGAMENKGLNIFNSALVLANPRLTLDSSYQAIESVIAHEYFHNWTGNRVTCRDWFQLCLKEGLTVYRDQEFSKTVQDRDLTRIQEVRTLLERQVPEDTGPLSHPPRPDKYIEINNLYTATVYEKGAECVRMLELLLGKETFVKSVKHYLKKFDGSAVTQEDFVAALEEISQKDLKQFMLWYTQPGIPELSYQEDYDKLSKEYSLTLSQKVKKHPDYNNTEPRHIPISLGLYIKDKKSSHFIEMKESTQTFVFKNFAKKPILSLLQGFSAPVKVMTKLSEKDHLYLLNNEKDPFNRWKLFQDYFVKIIVDFIRLDKLKLEDNFIAAFADVLEKSSETLAVKSTILELPSEKVLFEHLENIDPHLVVDKKNIFRQKLVTIFKDKFLSLYKKYNVYNKSDSMSPQTIGARSFKNMCLGYLASSKDLDIEKLLLKQIDSALTMSDEYGAFSLLCKYYNNKKAVEDFYYKYSKEELVVNMWFVAQAATYSLKDIEKLLEHKDFNFKNPNRIRSLIGVFCRNNLSEFHKKDGSGYKFCAQMSEKLDKLNPQISSAIASSLVEWKKFNKKHQDLMVDELKSLRQLKNISKDLFEVVEKSLA
jgi:aminopeptidase N